MFGADVAPIRCSESSIDAVGGEPTQAANVIGAVAQRCRHHELSTLIFGATSVARCFGCCPRWKVSMMRMLPPQHGQGCSVLLAPRALR